MSYKDIPGRPGWQFRDNPPDPGGDQSDLWQKQNAGIRRFRGTQVYTETKKTTDPYGTNRGEISATYYNKEVKDSDFFSSLKVNVNEPDMVLDFVSNSYRSGESIKSLPDLMNSYNRSGNSTMTDADGLIKWAPHNLIPTNSTGSVSSQGVVNGFDTPVTTGDGPFGLDHWILIDNNAGGRGTVRWYDNRQLFGADYRDRISGGVFVKKDQLSIAAIRMQQAIGSNYIFVDLNNGNILSQGVEIDTASVTDVGNGWYLVKFSFIKVNAGYELWVQPAEGDLIFDVDLDGTSSILVSSPYSYKDNLGGMVDNPNPYSPLAPDLVLSTVETLFNGSTAAAYLPCLGHHIYDSDTSQFVNEGVLLCDNERTNLFDNSDFAGSWSDQGVSLSTSVDETSPAGTNYTIATITGDYSRLAYPFEGDSDSWYIYSVYARATETISQITLSLQSLDGVFSGTGGIMDLNSGTTPNTDNDPSNADGRAYIEPVGNGWYRCSRTFYVASDTSATIRILPWTQSSGGAGITGNTLELWGAQLEKRADISPYIPTSGSTVTRVSDNTWARIISSEVPAPISGYTTQVDAKATWSTTLGGFGAVGLLTSGGPQWRSFQISTNTQNDGFGNFSIFVNGQLRSTKNVLFEHGPNTRISTALTSSSTTANFIVNGENVISDAAVSGLPVIGPETSQTLGPGNYTSQGTVTVKSVKIWQGQVSVEDLQEITS